MTEALQQQNNASQSNALSNNNIGVERPIKIADNPKNSLSTSPAASSSFLEEPPRNPKVLALLHQVVRLGAIGLGMNLGPNDDRLDANRFALRAQDLHQKVLLPQRSQIIWVCALIVLDSLWLSLPLPHWLGKLEFGFGLFVALNFCLLGFTLFKQTFDVYLLELTLRSKRKINSEILVLYRFLANATILLVTVFSFAQVHHLNLIGLIASVGVGGITLTFASQKILEQALWSLVLYLDRPFVVDDYIHLPDRTFGRVESIGWRSTKVRLSGRGTLLIIPNSVLTQVSIENLTGAEKMISIFNLIFFRRIPDEEKALIRQVILESTRDIKGLDHKLTQITFQDATDAEGREIVQE